jgi:hypothetical protein
VNRRLDINCKFQLPRLPHFAAGSKIQQFATYARKMMTCVHHGVINRLLLLLKLLRLDQSRDKLRTLMPPNPAPTKFATGLRGATQQRKANDPSIGKMYSWRNCQRVIPSRTLKNTFICFLETRVGFSLCFFCVSNSAVWHSLKSLAISKLG